MRRRAIVEALSRSPGSTPSTTTKLPRGQYHRCNLRAIFTFALVLQFMPVKVLINANALVELDWIHF